MIKIAFVMPNFFFPVPCTKGGAIETLMTLLLEENERQGLYDLIFISPDEEERILEFKHGKVYKLNKTLLSENEDYGYDKEAARICQKEAPDYVIMEGLALRMKDCFENVVNRKRLAVHLHCKVERKGVYEEYFDKALVPSRYIGKQWSDSDKYLLWENCVDVNRFCKLYAQEKKDELRNKLGIGKDEFVILYCGRIAPEKGIAELVSAFEQMNFAQNIKLLVVGSENFANGNTSEFSINLVERMKLNNKIIYCGYIDNKELSLYYQSANVQVIPSIWEEPAGLVVIEGMLAGIPVVITNSGGLTEYASRYVRRVEKDDIKNNLINEIRYVYENYENEVQLAKESREYAMYFSKEQYYLNIEKIINRWE